MATFADDVRAGLCATPKRLASKYFYDEVGSALFDAITVLPEYYLTRAETEILREWGWEIVRALGNPVQFVELGSGSAAKTRVLIEEALRVQRALRYAPIDISGEALRASATALVRDYPQLAVHAFEGDYFSMLGAPELRGSGKMLAMFMGSNIGNYEPTAGIELLSAIAKMLRPGDGLLLGADLKKDPSVLRLAYDDPAGVTAAFNKNLLSRINRELGGSFDLRRFEHVPRYEETEGRVASYLRSTRAQDVRIDALDTAVTFAEGETIHMESSYKYSGDDLKALGHAAGLSLARTWTDAQERFSVNLYTPA
ncbi:MAG TPA: L-histidine N(alpha)-methyltransferase [Candidatus Baltobacteraceae bacterium]